MQGTSKPRPEFLAAPKTAPVHAFWQRDNARNSAESERRTSLVYAATCSLSAMARSTAAKAASAREASG
ncbi:MAG: hypothetical protein WCA23_18660, partial [Stellaceae bacterium]